MIIIMTFGHSFEIVKDSSNAALATMPWMPSSSIYFNHRQYGLCLESNDCHHLALMFSVTGT